MNRTWLGVGIVAILALALLVLLTRSGDDAPATTTTVAPTAAPTTAPPTTTTTTAAPTTTTTAAPPTTLDAAARAAEIEALVRDLEFALIKALYNQDSSKLADVVAGKGLWEALQDVVLEPDAYFKVEPTQDTFDLVLNEVKLDRPDCIVAEVVEDQTPYLIDGSVETVILVLWPLDDGPLGWKVAEVWAEGTPDSEWTRNCDIQDRSWRP